MARSTASLVFMLIVLALAIWIVRGSDTSYNDTPYSDTRNMNAVQALDSGSEPDSSATLVGKETCAECHRENFDLHAKSGHAQTFHKGNSPRVVEHFAGKTAAAGDPFGHFTYVAGEGGLKVLRHDDPDLSKLSPGNVDEELFQFGLGSGQNAITLINLQEDKAGVPNLLEHRVSWFQSHAGFGLTPGHLHHQPDGDRELFGELIKDRSLQQCIWCHTTSGTVVGGHIEDLVADVNCEKCHGPGSEHVRLARITDNPPPYSVGKSDWDFESELQLCGSCHRLPRHVDPKDIRDYIPMMLRFQPIGLVRSPCYLKADGKLMCSTCHDPHAHFKTKSEQQYIDDCIGCHQPENDQHTICPVSSADGCIECHMPATTVEQGMVFHDHWIRVRK
ncbi:C cytochrome precursor [Stieleria sp. JC731]|uniref:multiheme c-type cytochrome n=1 Tax=Pirellulaceae TaxID=2691357 RepID=UPI001E567D33|nr:multiheme c-type cytochrome [Stieleria sp. JC731]MCC9602309.1 C cytochrome precursor [Stieleria sp. JC731]